MAFTQRNNSRKIELEQRRIGKNGPFVSAIGLGCMGMSMGYGPATDEESTETLLRAIDLGVTLIDTADMYGWGHNEMLIGKAIKPHRTKITLATKMGFARRKSGDTLDYYIDGSPDYIQKACDASLKRLGVETIDLYYLHRVDPNTPIEDSIAAMANLVASGKIRYIGISEVKPATIRLAASVKKNCSMSQLAIAWLLAQKGNIIPIPGTKRVHYLENNIKAVNITLSPDDLSELNALFPLDVAKGKKYPIEFEREA